MFEVRCGAGTGERLTDVMCRLLKPLSAAAACAMLVSLASAGGGPLRAQGEAVPDPCDFATSGGYVVTDSGKKANFGVHGGCKNGAFWGHVNYMDHNSGYSVDSVEITGYVTPFPGSNIRDICGVATTNADEPQPVYFRIRLIDNGEPGNGDEFGIRLSNGYLVSMRLLNNGRGGGGNVQLHEPNPSTTAPDPAPDVDAMCNGVPAPVGGGGIN